MKILLLLMGCFFFALSPSKGAITDPGTDLKNGSVSGKIIDQVEGQPIAYASIVIKSASDQSTLTGGITTEDGVFLIDKLPEGNFILEVQYMGFKTYSFSFRISSRVRGVLLYCASSERFGFPSGIAPVRAISVISSASARPSSQLVRFRYLI